MQYRINNVGQNLVWVFHGFIEMTRASVALLTEIIAASSLLYSHIRSLNSVETIQHILDFPKDLCSGIEGPRKPRLSVSWLTSIRHMWSHWMWHNIFKTFSTRCKFMFVIVNWPFLDLFLMYLWLSSQISEYRGTDSHMAELLIYKAARIIGRPGRSADAWKDVEWLILGYCCFVEMNSSSVRGCIIFKVHMLVHRLDCKLRPYADSWGGEGGQ